MISFQLSAKLEKELKRFQGALVETYQEIESCADEEVDYLHRCALISTVGASTRIENAALTDPEIEWVDTTLTRDAHTTAFASKKKLILDKLCKDRERSVDEVVGNRDALTTVYAQAKELFPLRESTVKGLHRELLQYYRPARHHAGDYKTTPNRVVSVNHATREESVVLEPTPPGILTSTAVSDLIGWYNQTLPDYLWPLLTATEFVFRFLAIHPFQDGNGRLGRALFLMALLQSDDKYLSRVVPLISIDRHIEQNRSMYYTVLQQCSSGKYRPDPRRYRLEPLAWFFLRAIDAALKDVKTYRTRYQNLQRFSEAAMTVLRCFKESPEKRLQVSDIEVTTALPRRTIQRVVKTLSGQGFLQTLGQGAGSRYQLLF